MNKKLKDLVILVLAAAFVAVACIWIFSDGLEHIEDTNGPDNYNLTTITDENIINRDIGSRNMSMSSGLFDDGITFSSDKFTGVYEVFLTNFIAPSDLLLELDNYHITEGNFKMVIVCNDEIIFTFEPGMFSECYLQGLTGTVALRIAGESAAFTFHMDKHTCDMFDIKINTQ